MLALSLRAPLEHHDTVVENDAVRRLRELRHLEIPTHMWRVEFVDLCLGKFDKGAFFPKPAPKFRPVLRVHVFNKIDPVRSNAVIQRIEGLDDMGIDMAAVVQDDVEIAVSACDFGQK